MCAGDPLKLACSCLPSTGVDLCSQSTASRWEACTPLREVVRMTYAPRHNGAARDTIDNYVVMMSPSVPRLLPIGRPSRCWHVGTKLSEELVLVGWPGLRAGKITRSRNIGRRRRQTPFWRKKKRQRIWRGVNLALIRLRLLTNSGAASRQYLSSSQNSPWQSIACSGQPKSPLKGRSNALNSSSWRLIIQRMASGGCKITEIDESFLQSTQRAGASLGIVILAEVDEF